MTKTKIKRCPDCAKLDSPHAGNRCRCNEPEPSEGNMDPLAAVLSGEYELCIPADKAGESWLAGAFVRNAAWRLPDGGHTKIESHHVSESNAAAIIAHECVIAGLRGVLDHYHTRRFPVNPNA